MAHQPYFHLAVWLADHTLRFIMKMTMHIDEKVLSQVMKLTGAKTKTQAVELALADMARRHKMKALFSQGLGMTPDELRAAYTPSAADTLDSHALMVSDNKQAPYARRRSTR